MKSLLAGFTMKNLMIIAAMAALGIAVKPIVVPLAHMVSAPLFIPSGALAGGIYMMWLIVACGLTGKRGAATLCGLCQALLVTFTGITGSHGILSIVTYTLPGIAADSGLLIIRHNSCCLPCCFLAGLLANITGTFMVNVAFFSLPLVPLLLALAVAAFSGGLGGILAWKLLKILKKHGIASTPAITAMHSPNSNKGVSS